ncbi:hypothetical protein ACVB8X_18660 [Streptomyces sp. NRAIS4]
MCSRSAARPRCGGSATAIGLAVAVGAAREGAEVVMASRRQQSVDALERLTGSAEGRVLDATPLLLVTSAEASVGQARRCRGHAAVGCVHGGEVRRRSIRPGGSVVLTTGTAARRPWCRRRCGSMGSPPGLVRTELWRQVAEAAREGLFRSSAESLPVGRVGEPADGVEGFRI